jgi:membrane protease YdiL (CAAX protease family)
VLAVTILSGLFALLSKRKITPIPFKDGSFAKDMALMLVFFGAIMLVRLLGYWQEYVLAEKAGMIALSISAIVLIDRSSPIYFRLRFDGIMMQILWFVAGAAIFWIGFAIYRFGVPIIFGFDTTGVIIELPEINPAFFYLLLAFLSGNFAEELFFRGYIQTKLEQSRGFCMALLVQAGLFAIYHINYILSYRGSDSVGYIAMYLLFTGLFGIGMGLFFKLSKSILAATLVHAFWNFFLSPRFLVPKIEIDHGRSFWGWGNFDYMFATFFFVAVMSVWLLSARRRAKRCGQAI